MKMIFILVASFGFTAILKAQQLKSQPFQKAPSFKDQSSPADSLLRTLITDSPNLPDTLPLRNYTMPVLPLENNGTPVGKSEKGTVYTMKIDNMPLLKPKETNAAMPNAFSGKLLMEPLPSTKQKP